jgi:NAD-dependent SIR2 family protein deacetylase
LGAFSALLPKKFVTILSIKKLPSVTFLVNGDTFLFRTVVYASLLQRAVLKFSSFSFYSTTRCPPFRSILPSTFHAAKYIAQQHHQPQQRRNIMKSSSYDEQSKTKETPDQNEASSSGSKSDDSTTDDLAAELASKLNVEESVLQEGDIQESETDLSPSETSIEPNLQCIAKLVATASNILVLTGAGVSVAAGIPDFRTPGTGLYDNLKKYKLPYAEAVFDVQYYRNTPEPFVLLSSELWPSPHDTAAPKPTLTHSFVKILSDRKRLLRLYSQVSVSLFLDLFLPPFGFPLSNASSLLYSFRRFVFYAQNIDGLEHMAEIPESELVECHGHFRSASCIRCKSAADIAAVQHTIVVEKRVPKCDQCNANVKPDIVFFGEQLPELFHTCLQKDLPKADLLLIMGTSLQVPPVAHIPNMVSCSTVLINRERVGGKNIDYFLSGNCDESVLELAKLLGWREELLKAHAKVNPQHAAIAAKTIISSSSTEDAEQSKS